MIDLHTHTTLSDGALIPAELIRRAQVRGCRAVGLTDHVDAATMDFVIPRLGRVCRESNRCMEITAIWGGELTHVPPPAIPETIRRARELGALLVLVHGETLMEPVMAGTNRAAIEGGADILAHPGLITVEDADLAARRGVYLEISTRRSHGLSNGHVAAVARETGAPLMVNSDAHRPGDLVDLSEAIRMGRGAGMTRSEVDRALANSRLLLGRCLERLAGQGGSA